MWNKKIFPQKRFSPYLELLQRAKTFMVFLDELETYGKLEAKNWAHIPHVQTQAAFELSDEAFQVGNPKYKPAYFIYVHFRQNIW